VKGSGRRKGGVGKAEGKGRGKSEGSEGKGKTLWICFPLKNFLATPLQFSYLLPITCYRFCLQLGTNVGSVSSAQISTPAAVSIGLVSKLLSFPVQTSCTAANNYSSTQLLVSWLGCQRRRRKPRSSQASKLPAWKHTRPPCWPGT